MEARVSKDLFEAAERGDLSEVQRCVDHGADLNGYNENRWTPVGIAAQNGHAGVVKMLLKRGANVDATYTWMQTSLHIAAQNGHVDVVKVLLEQGATIDATDEDGWTPLHIVSQLGLVEVVKTLIENGATVDATDRGGFSPLHISSKHGHVSVVRMMLDSTANVEATSNNGWTPLHSASQSGHVDVVKMLLERGATVDAANKWGQTSLRIAAQVGHIDIVRTLLDHGATVDAIDYWGQTPLRIASQNGGVGVVKTLLENGASIDATSKNGWTSLYLAAQNGHGNVVKMLLENGATIDSTSHDGQSPLHVASRFGHIIVVKTLLAAGADLFATISKNGKTARDVATAGNRTAVVEALDQCAQDRSLACFFAGDHAMAEKHASLIVSGLKLDKSAFAWIGDRLYQRGQLDQALAAFEKGTQVDPTDVHCIQGKEDVKLTMQVAKTFRQEDLFARLAQDDSMRDQLEDESFVYMVKSLQANPSQFDRRDEGMNRVFQYLQRFSESIVRPQAPQPLSVQGPCQLPVVWTISLLTDKAILPIEEQVRGLECRVGVVNTPSAECSYAEIHVVTVPVESEVVALVFPFVRMSRVLLDVLEMLEASQCDVSRVKFAIPHADSIDETVGILESIHTTTTALRSETLLREYSARLTHSDVSTDEVEEIYNRVVWGAVEFVPDTIDRVKDLLRRQTDETQAIVGGLVRSGQRKWKCHRHGSSNSLNTHASN